MAVYLGTVREVTLNLSNQSYLFYPKGADEINIVIELETELGVDINTYERRSDDRRTEVDTQSPEQR